MVVELLLWEQLLLEHWSQLHFKGSFSSAKGDTNIFIYPGFEFRLVDAMITNFHLPKSSLLMLVSAFIGIEKMLQIYQYAIEKKYRFFSYGDAMLLEKKL